MANNPDECKNCTYLQERESVMGLASDVKAIKEALVGNDYTEGKGLIHRVKEHEEYIQKQKIRWAKASVIGFIVIMIITKWTWIVDKIFKS